MTVNYRPPEEDWRETEIQKKIKLEKKVQDTFELMRKSSKVNKLLYDNF